MSKVLAAIAMLSIVSLSLPVSVPAFAEDNCQQKCPTKCGGKGLKCISNCQERCAMTGSSKRK